MRAANGISDLVRSAFVMSAKVLQAGRASLLLRATPGGPLVAAAAVGISPEVLEEIEVTVGEGIAGTVAERGTPLLGVVGEETFLSIPVPTSEGVEGVLNLTNRAGGQPYQAEDLTTAGALAEHIGHLLDHAHHAFTPLISRSALDDALQRELARSKRTGQSFALALLAVEGEPLSEQAVASISQGLQRILRPYDTIVYGGSNRFGILLAGPSEPDGELMQRIGQAIARSRGRAGFTGSVRVGVARSDQEGARPAEFIDAAERALKLVE